MSPLDDPEAVRREYACEDRLAARKAAYQYAEGPDPREIALSAVAEVTPRRVLEVGAGEGELAEHLQLELGFEVVALDQSPRMVELCRARGVDAVVGDVSDLPFEEGSFDCAVAAFMLYHVARVDRALSELARVLRQGGRLVAVTNARDHKRELRELVGHLPSLETTFSAENGEDQLRRHFARVERRDAFGWIAFPSREEAQAHVDASLVLTGGAVLPPFEGPLRVTRAPVVFVADKA